MLRRLGPVLSLLALTLACAGSVNAETVKVNAFNFPRAETDNYFARFAKLAGGIAQWYHIRVPTPLDKQDVIRMNRDTLYSAAVFDLDAGPVTITLPDTKKRFMSLLVVNQDHHALDTVYAPGQVTLSKDQVGTRYVSALIRVFMDPNDPADVKLATQAQDAIRVEQAKPGELALPDWDPETLTATRAALVALEKLGGVKDPRFGKPNEVDYLSWLVSTASAWGGNPPRDAVYPIVFPRQNDGKTAFRLTLKEVPVDAFWSVTVYDAQGFLFENPQRAYSVNSVTGKPEKDGSVVIQFGGDPKLAANFLAITPGWNYVVRLYRPRPAILDGSWQVPAAVPLP